MSALAARTAPSQPEVFAKEELVALSDALLAEPDLAITRREEVSPA